MIELIKSIDPILKQEIARQNDQVNLIEHCLLHSGVARDVLHKYGCDARLLFVRMYICVPERPDVVPVSCGDEELAPISSETAPFHCVVIAEEWLYDPTYLQAWRPRFGPPPAQFILMNVAGNSLDWNPNHSFGVEFGSTRISYSPHKDQIRFLAVPDARRDRRRPIVRRICRRIGVGHLVVH